VCSASCSPHWGWEWFVRRYIFRLGGLDLSWSFLDWDSRSQHCQRASLDDQKNLDNFKKLVSTIEKSRFCLDAIFWSQKFQSRSRFIEIYQKSWFFLHLDQDLVDFITFLNLSRFLAWSPSRSLYNVEIPWLILKSLDQSQKSWFVLTISTVSIKISTQQNLDQKVSI
jgi:hypothetical protein